VLAGLFVAIWRFLTPPDRRESVPFTDFVADVHAGRVDEIHIQEREFTYRVRQPDGHPMIKMAIGPIPDQELIGTLKPTDPDAPLPKIYFEK